MPSANLCLDCKKEEVLPDGTPRPIEEKVIRPPFGEQRDYSYERKFGDQDNQSVFDGEDAWQAVARYGTSETPSDLGEERAQYPNVYVNWDEDLDGVEEVDNIPYYLEEDGKITRDYTEKDRG